MKCEAVEIVQVFEASEEKEAAVDQGRMKSIADMDYIWYDLSGDFID